jgi:hypothetical protein
MPIYRIPGNGVYESTTTAGGSPLVVLIKNEGRMDRFRWTVASVFRSASNMLAAPSKLLARVANSIDKPLPA